MEEENTNQFGGATLGDGWFYSHRQPWSRVKDDLAELERSLSFRQAGREGQERMKQLVSVGLPATSDTRYMERTGVSSTGQQMFRVPVPQPYGSFGGVGVNNEGPARTPRLPQMPTTTQPETSPASTQQLPNNSLGVTGNPMAFTSFGQTQSIEPTPTASIPKIYEPFDVRGGNPMAFTPFGESRTKQAQDARSAATTRSGLSFAGSKMPFAGNSASQFNFQTTAASPFRGGQSNQYGTLGLVPRFPYSGI